MLVDSGQLTHGGYPFLYFGVWVHLGRFCVNRFSPFLMWDSTELGPKKKTLFYLKNLKFKSRMK